MNTKVRVYIGVVLLTVLGLGLGCYLRDGGPEVVLGGTGVKWIAGTQGRLVFVATDEYSRELLCDVELNDRLVWTMLVESGEEAQCGMTLREGVNTVRVRVTDSVGNSVWSPVYVVYVDGSAPDVDVMEFRVKR